MSSTPANTHRHDDASTLDLDMPLPIVRSPMLDRRGQLVAYELLFHREELGADAEATLMRRLLAAITDGGMGQLVRGNRAFVRLSRDLLMEQTDVLAQHPRLGIIVDPVSIADADLVPRLQQLADRGCALMLDLCELDAKAERPYGNLEPLLAMATWVRLDAGAIDAKALALRSAELHARGLNVIAGFVDDPEIYSRCENLPVQGIQGRYLLLPEQFDLPVLTASRLNLLRLMKALQENNPGPVELGEIIREDAVLSYKLLGCVNSAYFALPRQLKSIQQAAIFFGVARMRNWIYTMALGGMDDRPPELLRAALIRAHMCEKLSQDMPVHFRDMAFMAGLLSLLDTLMCAPMTFLLSHLPLAPEIHEALVENRGPFAVPLRQIYLWEAGELGATDTQPQDIERMSAIYLESTQWADQVYNFANRQAY
ncbi:EAL and modified HD-GYP domain-containing signal transduction protein [Rhodanobacter sp. ANJX3]|uniref:EAL and HDOD domain-containing protein n=1 Tax=Rhodanobacter sp. ANJX3 TaxID=2723083 RepID=UPI0018132E85|nr:HDOD domain-containing protein [Rhodanobacter sp. ANJX3]MBB5359987.1 EAL and modified HD-GYP domain-containing signal transduction protein [Rhodanobacter sp. ANJX3]